MCSLFGLGLGLSSEASLEKWPTEASLEKWPTEASLEKLPKVNARRLISLSQCERRDREKE
jgi:hypothetical protein